MLDFDLEAGVEHKVHGSYLVPIGGKLPYYLELRSEKLLDFLMGTFAPTRKSDKKLRKRIRDFLYPKTRPGFYLEINEHLHLSYADQRDGHSTQHWWRLFFGKEFRQKIEYFTQGTSLTVPRQEDQNSNTNRGFGQESNAEGCREWGGMNFRSATEIKIAEELDKHELLFFANSRGRIGQQELPVSEKSGCMTGRLEVDFLVFYKRKCMILEVDGQHHQEGSQTLRDYVRDRVLLREGIPTVRFTANDCYNQTANVVIEFLNIF